MANTTWNPSDKTAGLVLSGSNLIATLSGTVPAVRSVDRVGSGKYYWECTGTTWAGSQTGIGVAHGSPGVISNFLLSTEVCYLAQNGTIWVGQTNSGVTLGARASGNIIGIALDGDNKLIWFRVAPSGNWNGNAGFAPGGTGGISLKVFSPDTRYPLYATCGGQSSVGDVITANFGASAFSGAVPASYTSGFPSPSVPPLYAVETQIGIEHWGPGAPVAQVTQTGLEVWGAISAVTRAALVTQLAVEQWASVPLPAVTGGQTAVSVNTG